MKKARVAVILLNTALLIGCLFTITPLLWMIVSSFKTNAELSALSQTFLPQAPTMQNFLAVLEKFNLARFFGNSLIYALSVTVISTYTSVLAGFVLSKYHFRGRNVLFTCILMTMMVPGVVTIIPRYSLMQTLGWLDSYQALIVPAAFTSFGIFMMRQACMNLPDELLEAARIDGANEFYTFHRIVIPLNRNALSSIAIFQFLWNWEDFLWPYLVIRSEEKQVLAVALNLFSGRYETDYAGLFAVASIAILPVVIFYLIFQRSFIEGISSAAVKG
jgi:multiple sugar transport system permease protein/raffinose/stachyose/melibiose transport system permease protein